MLRLNQLEIVGFGPFAERQLIQFPSGDGVVVIYGENMRGKTTLLNAIRYAFFGKVLGRGRRERHIHVLSNRERAAQGKFGFSVTLWFDFNGEVYELYRGHTPLVERPQSDGDYRPEILLKRGRDVLNQQDRDRALAQIFPWEISRFFLFDGELLQEYEELILNESETGRQISKEIERILGVPILKAGRRHLRQLAEEAERQAAIEASRHAETAGLGSALQQAITIREAQRAELERQQSELEDLLRQKTELDEKLSSNSRAADLMARRQAASNSAAAAAVAQLELRSEVKRLMADGWRTAMLGVIKRKREEMTSALGEAVDVSVLDLRRSAVASGECAVCEQRLDAATRERLRDSFGGAAFAPSAEALANLRALNGFTEIDVSGELRQLVRRIDAERVEEEHQLEEAAEILSQLADSDQASIRSTQATYAEVLKQIGIVEHGIEKQGAALAEQEKAVETINRKLRNSSSSTDLSGIEAKTKRLRDSEAVFDLAIDEYKQDLRDRVQASASELFLAMTTEQTDYAGLTINNAYGLDIQHVDGTPEDARSAGAEHVVALALMGALQQNAPLRGPIVMDSPFGRLDDGHTSNVLRGLHRMADQVVLLVYEAEVGRERARELLGGRLIAEYELRKINSRKTEVTEVVR